jgi:GT2 family glycosyltransferase
MDDPLVEVIIVHWKGYVRVRECLQALRGSTHSNINVTLVDNESDPEQAKQLGLEFPEITIEPLATNEGFTGGNNHALKNPEAGSYYLLLNDDTIPSPMLISKLLDLARSSPDIGIVGPKLFNPDGTLWGAGLSINLWTGTSPILSPNSDSDPYEVDVISGCALMIKGEVIQKIGMLDTSYFMYYEEQDWCIRAARAGYRVMVAPNASIIHNPVSNHPDKRFLRERLLMRNRFLLVRKQGTRLQLLTTVLYVFGFYIWGRSIILLTSGRAGLISPLWHGAAAGLLRMR